MNRNIHCIIECLAYGLLQPDWNFKKEKDILQIKHWSQMYGSLSIPNVSHVMF